MTHDLQGHFSSFPMRLLEGFSESAPFNSFFCEVESLESCLSVKQKTWAMPELFFFSGGGSNGILATKVDPI